MSDFLSTKILGDLTVTGNSTLKAIIANALTLSGTLTIPSGDIVGLSSGNITTALGFTPYNATNPSGYTTNVGTLTSSSTLDATKLSGLIPAAVTQAEWDAAYTHSTSAHAAIGTYDGFTALAGATILSDIAVTNGIMSGITTRELTLANLGYTGSATANDYTHPDYTETDWAFADNEILDTVTVVNGHVNGYTKHTLTLANLG